MLSLLSDFSPGLRRLALVSECAERTWKPCVASLKTFGKKLETQVISSWLVNGSPVGDDKLFPSTLQTLHLVGAGPGNEEAEECGIQIAERMLACLGKGSHYPDLKEVSLEVAEDVDDLEDEEMLRRIDNLVKDFARVGCRMAVVVIGDAVSVEVKGKSGKGGKRTAKNAQVKLLPRMIINRLPREIRD